MSDSSSSSDDSGAESDIGAKMAQIHNRQLLRQKQQQQPQDDDSDDDDDDSDDGVGGDVVLLRAARSRTGSKRGGAGAVDAKLQKLQRSRAVRSRRQRQQKAASKRQRKENDDDYSSSSSDDDDDEIQIVDAPAARKDAKKTKYSRAVDSSIDVDSDDDSDNDNNSNSHDDHQQNKAATPVSAAPMMMSERAVRAAARQQQRCGTTSSLQQEDLQRRSSGIPLNNDNKDALQELQKLSAAKAQLENASSNHHRSSVLSPLRRLNEDDDDDVQVLDVDGAPTPAAPTTTLHLTVQATVRHKKDARLVEHKQAVVTVQDTQSAQDVLDQALQQWQQQYPSSAAAKQQQSIGVLKFNGKTLQNRFALAMHGIPAYGAVLHADITLLDSSSCGGAGGSKRPAAANYGKLIQVTLRSNSSSSNGKGKHQTAAVAMKVGQREPLRNLVERYEQKHNCRVQRLLFDGDALDLQSTPETHDMEDEDLIDVVVRA